MKKSINKISYDKDSKVLSFEIKKTKSVDSDIFGNLVVDYDKKGAAVRASLYDMDFSRFKENLKAVRSYARKFGLPINVS
ncbi:hypothetical protein A3A09_02140 [Candidatus Nomurabacteria bacterium RIFCSPLOWO2_01_FULL_42_20]|uniref:DUF2283 domain-containing protein n=1 Tax=Candidatus Nomurabacteria bacterium RIFCSPHIGHO2_01_FULL_42_16 TaxID=1801743 RepID=A0A1F6VL71_9BACT|nr:MAG: hypothetical protein A2824_02410 [Candidatus Nomurabacteria bacterium RIFCSPHIGHO2_01_FULL_42_16]OGI91526.1 MAG: hypothetical protein A3A09_02140 [Candidatus Nomurabacteria bacterium RIFCSPLOWO2_01_FULL_42_20]